MTTFLVGVDGSEGGRRAALYAARRARAEKARLLLVHVVEHPQFAMMLPEEFPPPPPTARDESEGALTLVLQPLKEELDVEDLEVELLVRHGHVADLLAELAQEHRADQVFAGRRGRSRMASLIFGSVSKELVQSCPVPITVVPLRYRVEEESRPDREIEGSAIA